MQDKNQQRDNPSVSVEDHSYHEQQLQSKRLKLDEQNKELSTNQETQHAIQEHEEIVKNASLEHHTPQQSSSDPLNQDQQHLMDGEDDASEEPLELTFSWRNSNFQVSLEGMVTIQDLKAVIYSVTSVQPDRQKILGLVVGQIPSDDVLLSTIEFKYQKGVHFKLLGSPVEEQILRPPEDSSTQLQQSGSQSVHKSRHSDCVLQMSRVRAKLDEIAAKLELNIMNPPRLGKKLLVLDLDYTLMDSKAYSDYSVHALDMARPCMNFLFGRRRI